MKQTRSITSFALILSLSLFSFLTLPIQSIKAQDATKIALQRGYRTGYSDGYMAGYRDVLDNATKSYTRHNEYNKADRAYSKDYGALEDYRDGYQQGFEVGYNTGFEKRGFDATLPTDLKKRGSTNTVNQTTTTTTVQTNQTSTNTNDSSTNQNTVIENNTAQTNYVNSNTDAIIVIPSDTELILELNEEITTERSKEGDKFTAKVISPMEINGAIIEGRISKIQKPGRIKRRAEVLLTFDRIILSEGRWANFNAILTEVLPVKGDNVKRVDTEGTVEGKSSLKGDAVKVGAATGTGLVVGAVVAGPVGAAVGAGVGAAFGVGAVVVERGKHVKLNKQQQLRIKSTYETQIR
jgi:type IV secretion system protein VirB10